MKLLPVFLLCSLAFADGPGKIESRYLKHDFKLTANPNAKQWKDVKGILAENDPMGAPVVGHAMEVRSRWTDKNLYLLFVCPYEALYLKPSPSKTTETNKLWEWDVAEAFIGSDFDHIRQYKEFQVSPQGEWVDLDIDRDHPKPEGGWRWNSGYSVSARIDAVKKIWVGEMRIPLDKIDTRPPRAGNEMRINLFRIQGPSPSRKFVAWQKTGGPSYHVPEAFGRIILAK